MESIVGSPSGRYRGVHVDGVHAFLGIRYGDLVGRFRPAVRSPRTSDVVDCLAYGPVAMQFDARLLATATTSGVASLYFPHGGQQAEGRPMSEDCLTLNVWTPATDRQARLPVVVWVHGGAFRAGTSAATVTHGAGLAATGRAVVVSVTHRLGLFGFLGLGEHLGDDYALSGVAGITDLVLALEWVAENIDSFGGDPSSVTVMGQSGGGTKVAALLAAPRARDLVARAIVMSAAGLERSPEVSNAQTDEILAAMGVRDARELIDWPAARLTDAQRSVSATGIGPVLVSDGVFIDESRREELSANRALLVGHTSHDWSFFVADQPWYRGADRIPEHALFETVGIAADDAAAYRRDFPRESARLLSARILTDRSFGAVAADLANEYAQRGTATYRYEFAYETDAWPVPLGATHCVEVPFVFLTTEWARIAGCRPERTALAAEVSAAWLEFAASGVPRAPSGVWPRYRPDEGPVMRIDADHWQTVDGRLPATA